LAESEETAEVAVEAGEGRTPSLRKRELIDRIVKRSGVKKKAAKPVVEALLAELGETLASGRELVLPPLGRIKINREKALANGRVMILKVRQKDAQDSPEPAPETVAAD
jgi:DNA-binding protein HU-alpha